MDLFNKLLVFENVDNYWKTEWFNKHAILLQEVKQIKSCQFSTLIIRTITTCVAKTYELMTQSKTTQNKPLHLHRRFESRHIISRTSWINVWTQRFARKDVLFYCIDDKIVSQTALKCGYLSMLDMLCYIARARTISNVDLGETQSTPNSKRAPFIYGYVQLTIATAID